MKKGVPGFFLMVVGLAAVVLAGCSHIEEHINEYRASPSVNLYDPTALPPGQLGAAIAYGHDIFVNPQKYLKGNVKSAMSCEACHLNGGTKDRAGSMVGTYARFPQWNKRAQRMITLQDRLAECFLYSMNGQPPAYNSREMIAMVAYIAWLSRNVPTLSAAPPTQHASVKIPSTPPNLARGAQIYAQKCSMCHQASGAGLNAAYTGPNGSAATANGHDPGLYAQAGHYPPLWGPTSFNTGAGMAHFRSIVPFVYYNMPANAPGSLSLQEAYDVSAYVLSHSHPKFNANRLITQPAKPAKYF